MSTVISSPKDMPKVKHWALITRGIGDDGWGGTTDVLNYRAFLDKQELLTYVRGMLKDPYSQSFKIIEVSPLELQIDLALT